MCGLPRASAVARRQTRCAATKAACSAESIASRSPSLPTITTQPRFSPSAECSEQPRQEFAAVGQTVDDDVFVECVRAGALHAEPVKRRDAHGAGEIAIRTAARA